MTALTWQQAARVGWLDVRRRVRAAVGRVVLSLATPAGRAVGAARYLPGVVAGGAFVVAGFQLASWVGWTVIGVLGLLADRRIG